MSDTRPPQLSTVYTSASVEDVNNLLLDIHKSITDIHTNLVPNPDFQAKFTQPTYNGLSLLEVKNHTLFKYNQSLVHWIASKIAGQADHSKYVDELIRSRLVLDKVRPLETKIQYRINKFLKLATADPMPTDTLQYKANLVDFEDGASAGSEPENEDGIYRPPKLAPMSYTESKRQGDDESVRRRNRNSSDLIRDFEHELSDMPERHSTTLTSRKPVKADVDRQQYEEDHFLRVTLSKKQRKAIKQEHTANSMSKEINTVLHDVIEYDNPHNSNNSMADMLDFLDSKRSAAKRNFGHSDTLVAELGSSGLDEEYLREKKKARRQLTRQVGKERRSGKNAS